jgi:hypothetical protein
MPTTVARSAKYFKEILNRVLTFHATVAYRPPSPTTGANQQTFMAIPKRLIIHSSNPAAAKQQREGFKQTLHTPEPWPEFHDDDNAPDMEWQPNYARARLCVNACVGFVDPAAERAELIEALRVLAEVFQSFCNDVGNHHESYQREHITSARAIVAKHKAK